MVVQLSYKLLSCDVVCIPGLETIWAGRERRASNLQRSNFARCLLDSGFRNPGTEVSEVDEKLWKNPVSRWHPDPRSAFRDPETTVAPPVKKYSFRPSRRVRSLCSERLRRFASLFVTLRQTTTKERTDERTNTGQYLNTTHVHTLLFLPNLSNQ